MNYILDPAGSEPAYIQLYHYFVKDIVTGVYPFGSKLPSKRVVAAETGVSVITVEHTMELLCDEGYAESRQRSGCYVTYREADFPGVPDLTPRPRQEAPSPLPDVSHSPGQFPFTVLAKAMRKVLQDQGEKILIKSPNQGCLELRQEICAYLSRSRGIAVEAEQIVVGSGAEYLYGMIAQLFPQEQTIAVEDPCYEKIRQVYETMGKQCDALPLSQNGIPAAALQQTRANILHITPFNSYPSGVTADISKKREYLNWARARGAILIEDNYDSELTVSRKPETPLFSMADGVSVIYLNTFSKTIAPAMRAGYMVLPHDLLPEFQARLGFYSCTVPLFEQYVLAELLRNGDYQRHINRVRRQRRRAMEE